LATAVAPALIATIAWSPAAHAGEADTDPGAWIGVKVTALSDNWRDEWAYRGAGVLVTEVEAQGPADQIGVVPGDVLVAVGSTSLRSRDDLAAAHGRVDPTQPIPVVIARQHGRM